MENKKEKYGNFRVCNGNNFYTVNGNTTLATLSTLQFMSTYPIGSIEITTRKRLDIEDRTVPANTRLDDIGDFDVLTIEMAHITVLIKKEEQHE